MTRKFDTVLTLRGYVINEANKCIYSQFENNYDVIIWLSVDDMLIMEINLDVVNKTKQFFNKYFEMKDFGVADVILEIKIVKHFEGIILIQSHSVEKLFNKFNQYNCIAA